MGSADWLADTLPGLVASHGMNAATGDASVREHRMNVGKIAASFASLAGGFDNAVALVEALRDGRDVPTAPMDWSDVRMALILARDALTAVGVMRPSGELLRCVLLGGEAPVPGARVVAFKGVLTMRAEGHGWGRIASERFQRAAVTRLE